MKLIFEIIIGIFVTLYGFFLLHKILKGGIKTFYDVKGLGVALASIIIGLYFIIQMFIK